MSALVDRIYKAAKNDAAFVDQFCSLPGNRPPRFFASEIEKHMFVSAYSGWLVGFHGPEQGQRIYDILKAGM